MLGAGVLAGVTASLGALGLIESTLHARNLAKIPVRVHVNGTRGKSTVTRLIAAGLRRGGRVTFAKTTGTLARAILPDGSELPVRRLARPNVIEQIRIVRAAASRGAEALVIECMAVQPHLQALSEERLVRATHAVITNARPDHLEVMGPTEADVALALAGTIPVGGRAYTAERRQLSVLRAVAEARGAALIEVDGASVRDEEIARFRHVEHKDNVALALAVCGDLGVARELALEGMIGARADAGAMTTTELDFFGRRIVFVNGFAANDPESSEMLWELARARAPDAARTIAVFNCRADRPERSRQLGEACARWAPADHYVLMGTGTQLLSRAAFRAGIEAKKLVVVEELEVSEIFEVLVELAGRSALIMGLGNTGGHGLELVSYFKNRSLIPSSVPP